MTPPTAESNAPPFAAHARQVVRALRGAFAELLTAIGADPSEPQAISRQIKINKNLAWKISKIVQTDDPALVLEQLPGISGLRIFLKAADRAGAHEDLLKTARDAIGAYEELIRVHSGDRATLEIMGNALTPNGRSTRDEQHRKLLYQGSSYVWGVQTRVLVKSGLIGPGSEPDTLDFASLNALVDFRRLRPDVSWPMITRRSQHDDGRKMSTTASEPIDPVAAERFGIPVMAEFCTKPLPELRRVQDGLTTSYELVEGPVGNTGAITCAAGLIQRNVPALAEQSEEPEWGEHSATCDTPAELMIVDLFIHEQFDYAIPPEVKLRSLLPPAFLRNHPNNHMHLPLNEQLKDLGAGPFPLPTPEVPRYNEMVRAMFERTGWDADSFRGFRMKIAYPPCPTALVLRYQLPVRSDA